MVGCATRLSLSAVVVHGGRGDGGGEGGGGALGSWSNPAQFGSGVWRDAMAFMRCFLFGKRTPPMTMRCVCYRRRGPPQPRQGSRSGHGGITRHPHNIYASLHPAKAPQAAITPLGKHKVEKLKVPISILGLGNRNDEVLCKNMAMLVRFKLPRTRGRRRVYGNIITGSREDSSAFTSSFHSSVG